MQPSLPLFFLHRWLSLGIYLVLRFSPIVFGTRRWSTLAWLGHICWSCPAMLGAGA